MSLQGHLKKEKEKILELAKKIKDSAGFYSQQSFNQLGKDGVAKKAKEIMAWCEEIVSLAKEEETNAQDAVKKIEELLEAVNKGQKGKWVWEEMQSLEKENRTLAEQIIFNALKIRNSLIFVANNKFLPATIDPIGLKAVQIEQAAEKLE